LQAESGDKLTDASAIEHLKKTLSSLTVGGVGGMKRPQVGSSAGGANSHLYGFLGKPKRYPCVKYDWVFWARGVYRQGFLPKEGLRDLGEGVGGGEGGGREAKHVSNCQ